MRSNDEIFKTELFTVDGIETEAPRLITDFKLETLAAVELALVTDEALDAVPKELSVEDGHRDLIKAMQDTRESRNDRTTVFTTISTSDNVLKDQDMDIVNDLLWGTAGFKCSI